MVDKYAKVEIITSREVPLGGPRAMTVHRTLPQRQRSLVGAWCFVDHYGPDQVRMDVAPHPHTGLQTVSWLFEGAITHHDSSGNHAVVLPGEVNLMTAGAGISHSEVSTQNTQVLHGVQLWTVLPEKDRQGPRRFEHYAPPLLELEGAQALVFLGELLGHRSPVHTFTPLLGAEIRLNPGARLTVEINPAFEHAVLVDSPQIHLGNVAVNQHDLAYTGVGETELVLHNPSADNARVLIIGGEPFAEEIIMWWNFIARSYAEIELYRQQWQDQAERFGYTQGYIGYEPEAPTWLPAPRLPNTVIKPRKNPAPIARPL